MRTEHEVSLPLDGHRLEGTLTIPRKAGGIVLFAHGSGSSRHSPRNRFVAGELQRAGLATLLFDLLSAEEEQIDERTGALRFDIGLLAERLATAVDWVANRPEVAKLRIGLFGASTGAAAALIVAARKADAIGAVVSRGGRPDLAADALVHVCAPTLLIVGGDDHVVLRRNREAAARMRGPVRVEIVRGATHLFEEPGKLEIVADLAADWFDRHLGVAPSGEAVGH